MDDIVKSTLVTVKKTLGEPKNKNAVVAAGLAYLFSKENKERNAAIAGVLAYTLFPNEDEDE